MSLPDNLVAQCPFHFLDVFALDLETVYSTMLDMLPARRSQ